MAEANSPLLMPGASFHFSEANIRKSLRLQKKWAETATLFLASSSNKVDMKTNEFKTQILPLKDNLFRAAFRITGNVDQAREVVEEVMLWIWNEQFNLMVIDDLGAYCLRMARNLALQKSAGEEFSRTGTFCFG